MRYAAGVMNRRSLGARGVCVCFVVAVSTTGGCSREPVSAPMAQPSATATAASPHASAAPSTSPEPTKGGPLREIPGDDPLVEGRVAFEGMARPTKGGVSVRGVTLDEDVVARHLGAQGKGGVDAHLGARVRVVATLGKVENHPKADEPAMQMRSGTFFVPRAVESITVVKPAEVLEGTLARSKGLFAIGGRMVTSDDLGWSLRDAKPGDRVRLWGQPRTYVCPPQAQCLIEGSIPLFDVGRAEKLP